jgi:hypothetical protein
MSFLPRLFAGRLIRNRSDRFESPAGLSLLMLRNITPAIAGMWQAARSYRYDFRCWFSIMESGLTARNRERFRRVSKARIFDGSPLKVNVYAVSMMVLAYLTISVTVSLFFSLIHETAYSLVFWALLPGALLGFILLVTERSLTQLKSYMLPRMGKLLTAFLLFFAHIICYLALSSIIFSYPVGYVMEKIWAMPGIGSEYSLFSGNFFLILALVSWLRNAGTSPCRCF